MKRVCVVEWPDGLLPAGSAWDRIAEAVRRAAPDILVTNEMPFGYWLPYAPAFDRAQAQAWSELHEDGLAALKALALPAVISSRPVMGPDRLANEAFVVEGGAYKVLHHKHLFPAEPGWEEAAWFEPHLPGFDMHRVQGVNVGVLLCTELMFIEQARKLGQKGAQLIVAPRASGASQRLWRAAATLAAASGGVFVATSNRWQPQGAERLFGGGGFALAPSGVEVAATSEELTIAVFDLDPAAADAAKHDYPAYVDERYLK